MKLLIGFGRFWYDFIVGDSAMLAIGGVAVLIGTALLVSAGVSTPAEVLLPLGILATLAVSLRVPR